jgi:hypothetical protein
LKLATFEISAPCGAIRRIGAAVDERLISPLIMQLIWTPPIPDARRKKSRRPCSRRI